MRNYLKITCFSFLLLFSTGTCFAVSSLLPSTPYTVELHQMNSNGRATLSSTSSATSDANSKISFDFSNVPTSPTFNFLIIKVIDSNGTVVTKSLVPAPAADGTNSLGINTSSTSQADLLEALGLKLGSDDPMVMAFGLMFTRKPNMSASDVGNLAIIAQTAIVTGMQTYMLANGVTAAQLTTFKNALVYNSAAGSTDLSAFSLLYKSAIDTPATATDDMAKAAGLVSDVFISAAAVSGIDLNVILASFDSAGISLESGDGFTAMNALTPAFSASMMQSVTGFQNRLNAYRVKQSYSAVLAALTATSAQQTQFTNAVTAMSTAMAAIDTTYATCFDGTIALDTTTAAGTGAAASACVAADINVAYQTAFGTFGTAISSTDADITTLLTAISSALSGGKSVAQLRTAQIGQYWGFDNTLINWPIPQAASVKFIADAMVAGGDLTYNIRSGLAIPTAMGEWFGSCSDGVTNGRTNCNLVDGGTTVTWTVSSATSFAMGNSSFNALLGIQEDIMIAENTRWEAYNAAATQAAGQAVKEAFISNLATITSNIGGTIDGAIDFTAVQKAAVVKGQQQPSLD